MQDGLATVMHLKVEILKEDRKLLGCTGVPGHPLSVFGKGRARERKQSAEMFREASGGTELTEESKEMLPWGMWLVNLGMILFFVEGESEGQTKSHKLADRGGDSGRVCGMDKLDCGAAVRQTAPGENAPDAARSRLE